MISKERSKNILEPTFDEIDKSEIGIDQYKFCYAIIGDEKPKSLKNTRTTWGIGSILQ